MCHMVLEVVSHRLTLITNPRDFEAEVFTCRMYFLLPSDQHLNTDGLTLLIKKYSFIYGEFQNFVNIITACLAKRPGLPHLTLTDGSMLSEAKMLCLNSACAVFWPLTEVADLLRQRWLRLFGCITELDLMLGGIEDHTSQSFVSQNKPFIKVSAWDNTVVPCTVSSIAWLILTPETPVLCFLTVADCLSYMAVHRQWSGLPCCCCPYLKRSASTCHVRTLNSTQLNSSLFICLFSKDASKVFLFRRSFLWLFTATFMVLAQWQSSFLDA